MDAKYVSTFWKRICHKWAKVGSYTPWGQQLLVYNTGSAHCVINVSLLWCKKTESQPRERKAGLLMTTCNSFTRLGQGWSRNCSGYSYTISTGWPIYQHKIHFRLNNAVPMSVQGPLACGAHHQTLHQEVQEIQLSISTKLLIDLDMSRSYHHTFRGEKFLQFDSCDNKHLLIFTTKGNLTMLDACDSWVADNTLNHVRSCTGRMANSTPFMEFFLHKNEDEQPCS